MESVPIEEYFDENARIVAIDDIIIIDCDEYKVVQLAASKSFTLMKLIDSTVYEHLGIKTNRCTLRQIRDMFGSDARFKKPGNRVLMSGTLFKNMMTGHVSILVYDLYASKYKVIGITDGLIIHTLNHNGQGGINGSNYEDLFGNKVEHIHVITDDTKLSRFLNEW